VVGGPEPHHLEGESFLAEIVWRTEPNWQIDLPEGLDALAQRDAMERCRGGLQLFQPNPHQPQGVCIQDVEATTFVHQHLGEPRVADDWIDNQRVLAWVGDAVWVILAAEGDGVCRCFGPATYYGEYPK
jgi:hypothetical protein